MIYNKENSINKILNEIDNMNDPLLREAIKISLIGLVSKLVFLGLILWIV